MSNLVQFNVGIQEVVFLLKKWHAKFFEISYQQNHSPDWETNCYQAVEYCEAGAHNVLWEVKKVLGFCLGISKSIHIESQTNYDLKVALHKKLEEAMCNWSRGMGIEDRYSNFSTTFVLSTRESKSINNLFKENVEWNHNLDYHKWTRVLEKVQVSDAKLFEMLVVGLRLLEVNQREKLIALEYIHILDRQKGLEENH